MIRVVRSLTLALVIPLALAGCASTETVKTTPEPVTVTAQAGTTEEENTGEDTTTEQASAGIGDTITLHGNDEALEIAVTVKKVVDPDESYDRSTYGFEAPDKGKRYVSLLLVLENTGSIVYDDSPTNGIAVIDTDDQSFDAADSGFFTRDPDIGSPTIRPGDRRQGWVTYMIPKRSKLRTFQMALDSGFAPEAGEWSLR
jgi:hypothetical protein